MFRFLTAICALALLSACAYPAGPRESAGTLLGAGAGAVLGSQFGHGTGRVVGAAIGTLAGALLGQDIGRSLDRADRQYLRQATQQSLETQPSHRTSTWVNPDTGNGGTVTPTRTFEDQAGRYCREYQQTITVAGREQQGYGTACRQPDGTWQISAAEPGQQPLAVQESCRSYGPEPAYAQAYPPVYCWPYPTYLSFSYRRVSGHHPGWERPPRWDR